MEYCKYRPQLLHFPASDSYAEDPANAGDVRTWHRPCIHGNISRKFLTFCMSDKLKRATIERGYKGESGDNGVSIAENGKVIQGSYHQSHRSLGVNHSSQCTSTSPSDHAASFSLFPGPRQQSFSQVNTRAVPHDECRHCVRHPSHGPHRRTPGIGSSQLQVQPGNLSPIGWGTARRDDNIYELVMT